MTGSLRRTGPGSFALRQRGRARTAAPLAISAQADPNRPPAAEPRDWTGHVVVCGLHDVALRTIEQLYLAGVAVTVVDDEPEPRLVASVHAWGIPYIARSALLADPLAEAGLPGASAVICAESSDLGTLETALQVRSLRPDVRIVIHLDNPAVGSAVEGITGEGSVLDVAGLFAPSVVDACLGRTEHDLDLDGLRFVAAEQIVPRDGTLRELYGDLAPIGILTPDEDLITACPGRDEAVRAGDRVSLVGRREEFPAAGLELDGDAGSGAAASRRRSRRRRAAIALRSAGDYFDAPVRWTLLAGLITWIVSSVILRAFYVEDGVYMSWLEAVYFTIETAATVGFGDFSFADQSPGLQVFAILLIIIGTAVVSLLFAFVTNALVSRRIEASLGRARIRDVEDHVILIGLGAIGMRVLEGLREAGREVVVIERDEDNRYASQARLLGVRVVIGDATLARTLDAANIDHASAVAVVTSDDMTNIETGLAVREALGDRWGDVPVVLRVFDTALGHRLEETFDFRHVWSTAAIAAPWFVGAAIGMGVLGTFYLGGEPFLVARLEVAAGGGLAGRAMHESGAGARVIALHRSGGHGPLEYPPRRDTRFVPGDLAYVAGPYQQLMHLLREELATR